MQIKETAYIITGNNVKTGAMEYWTGYRNNRWGRWTPDISMAMHYATCAAAKRTISGTWELSKNNLRPYNKHTDIKVSTFEGILTQIE